MNLASIWLALGRELPSLPPYPTPRHLSLGREGVEEVGRGVEETQPSFGAAPDQALARRGSSLAQLGDCASSGGAA